MDGNMHYSYDVDTLPDEERQQVNHISTEQLRHLVRLLDGSDVSEIEVKRVEEGMRLVLRKAKASSGSEASVYPLQTSEESEATALVPVEAFHTVTAPLVGVFHTWVKPKGKDLVAIGDHVKVGQLLGSIQSLNVLSELESPVAGKIVELIVQNGQAVEYGQPLIIIDTAEGA